MPDYFLAKLLAKFAAIRRGGFCILPARMHDVQTLTRFGVPPMSARTRWMFGSQRRLVRRWECETFIPKFGFLPQTSQTAAMTSYPFVSHKVERMRTKADNAGSCAEWHVTIPGQDLPRRSRFDVAVSHSLASADAGTSAVGNERD
jgi:hypothetical protein